MTERTRKSCDVPDRVAQAEAERVERWRAYVKADPILGEASFAESINPLLTGDLTLRQETIEMTMRHLLFDAFDELSGRSKGLPAGELPSPGDPGPEHPAKWGIAYALLCLVGWKDERAEAQLRGAAGVANSGGSGGLTTRENAGVSGTAGVANVGGAPPHPPPMSGGTPDTPPTSGGTPDTPPTSGGTPDTPLWMEILSGAAARALVGR